MSSKIELLGQTSGAADAFEQTRLQLTPGEAVLRTRRLRYERGRPFSYEEACLAMSRFPGLASGGSVGDYRIAALAQSCRVPLGRACEQVSSAEATSDIAKRLGVAPGHKLLRLDRVIFAAEGRPVEWQVALCRLNKDR
jgi:GntR family transcriptional regulator